MVLASSRPVHSAQNDDGLLKLGLFGCSCRGVGAANHALTVDAMVTLLAPSTIGGAIGEALNNAREILGKNLPGQTSAATEPNPFSKAIRGNLEHSGVQS